MFLLFRYTAVWPPYCITGPLVESPTETASIFHNLFAGTVINVSLRTRLGCALTGITISICKNLAPLNSSTLWATASPRTKKISKSKNKYFRFFINKGFSFRGIKIKEGADNH